MPQRNIESILVMGDSVAKGVVFHPEKKRYIFSKDGFIRRLGALLKANVHDLSKFGTTSEHGQKLLCEKLGDLNPDLVLIEYGGNDCDYNWDEVAQNPAAEHLPNTAVSAFAENILRMVNSLKSLNKIPVLMNLPPLNAQSYFKWFTKNDAGRAGNILKWLHDISKIYWWQEKYSYTIEKIAHATGAHLINVRNAFLKQKHYESLICDDGIHPNEKGQSLIEKTFVDYIEKHAAYMLAAH